MANFIRAIRTNSISNIELGDKIHTQLAKLKENKDLEQLICDGLELIKK